MKKPLLGISLSLLLLVFAFPAKAQAFKPSPWTKQQGYGEKTVHKLGFGIYNVTAGWTAVFFELFQRRNPLIGLIKGPLRAVSDTVGGALHVATFPIPVDIPLPGGGVQFERDPSQLSERPLS